MYRAVGRNGLDGSLLQFPACHPEICSSAFACGHGVPKMRTTGLAHGSSRHGLHAWLITVHSERPRGATPGRFSRAVLLSRPDFISGRDGAARCRHRENREVALHFPKTRRDVSIALCTTPILSHILFRCNIHIARIWLKFSNIQRNEFLQYFILKSSHTVEYSCNIMFFVYTTLLCRKCDSIIDCSCFCYFL